MAENSKIEWTDHTFNPWTGCTKVSPACDNCYAEGWAKRSGHVKWGPHADRKRTSVANWRKPLKWNAEAEERGVRYRVFCTSLADVFDNHRSILAVWREELWALIRATPHLDWQLLTKLPQNIAKMLPDDWGEGYPNIWLGTTAENQEEADRRIPHLLAVPAAVRFLSCEPLLGPVDLTPWSGIEDAGAAMGFGIDWIIVGGESGPGARPMHINWVRSLRDQCEGAGVPFFFKQWGEWLPISYEDMASEHQESEEIAGRLHEFDDGQPMHRVGKKKAGRRLDGVEHNAMPGRAR